MPIEITFIDGTITNNPKSHETVVCNTVEDFFTPQPDVWSRATFRVVGGSFETPVTDEDVTLCRQLMKMIKSPLISIENFVYKHDHKTSKLDFTDNGFSRCSVCTGHCVDECNLRAKRGDDVVEFEEEHNTDRMLRIAETNKQAREHARYGAVVHNPKSEEKLYCKVTHSGTKQDGTEFIRYSYNRGDVKKRCDIVELREENWKLDDQQKHRSR